MEFSETNNYEICPKCKSENVEIVFDPEIGKFFYECYECGHIWSNK